MLQHEHDRLQSEAAALLTKARIVELARACGWIYPGEHPLVIRDIPASIGHPVRLIGRVTAVQRRAPTSRQSAPTPESVFDSNDRFGAKCSP